MRPALFLLLQLLLLQLTTAISYEEEVYKPTVDKGAVDLNPNHRQYDQQFFHDPLHRNGQIRDRWCQEKCMRQCYCTYGYACRRSCIVHCDRGPYKGSARDPFMYSRSKRAAGAAPPPDPVPAAIVEAPIEDPDALPLISELLQEKLPYLDGFEFDDRAILRRKPGRPVWDPMAPDANAKKDRVHDNRWGKLCQDDGN